MSERVKCSVLVARCLYKTLNFPVEYGSSCISFPLSRNVRESYRDGWGIRMSGVNNKNIVIDFRSSQVRQAHSCSR